MKAFIWNRREYTIVLDESFRSSETSH